MFKKVFVFLILSAYPSFAQDKPPVAVMSLKAEGVSESESRIVTARLRIELFKTDKFSIVERERMDDILQEQGFQLSGCTSDECILEAGKLLGVKMIVAGEIGKMGDLYTLSIRLIDVQTGKLLRVASEDCAGAIDQVLTESVLKIAYKLADVEIPESMDTSLRKRQKARHGKHLGMEFNPALLLAGLGSDNLFLSGGFSLFSLVPQSEIAFPVYFRRTQSDGSETLTAAIHYRFFFSKYSGFYASVGAKYAHLYGEEDLGFFSDDTPDMVTIDKFGVFFGIGYRYISQSGIYWGAGIVLGTYFSDDSDTIQGSFLDQSKLLFDLEFLKIGYAF